MRTSPSNITTVSHDEVFVFGSNLSGKHGRGAAKQALKWGAKWGKGVGLQGRTYGIPTKNASIKTMSIAEIKPFVYEFIRFAIDNDMLDFLVTEIGCGLAGYEPKDIAPLFEEALDIPNIYLPERFIKELTKL